MKKLIALLLALSMLFVLAACGNKAGTNKEKDEEKEEKTEPTETVDPTGESEDPDAPVELKVMTHEEFMAAEDFTPVVIEAYVQNTQSWYDDKVTVYAQDETGGYVIYNMACSEDDYVNLVPGAKIRVTGYKTIWEGLHEIAEGATFEFIEDAEPYTATPVNLTGKLGTEGLEAYQGMYASFKGMTVMASTDAAGEEAAFLYNWDGSGEAGSDSDLYFNVSKNGQTYTFVVEYYLCDENSAPYKAVQSLQIGDVIDLDGYVYWYNGIQPHVIAVNEPMEPMTHEAFMAAEDQAPVVIEAYVQGTQSWWNDQITVYAQNEEGGYVIYNMVCSEEDSAKLVPGAKIRVTGYKAIWEGLHEIAEGSSFEFVDAEPYIAKPTDLTNKLTAADLENYQGMYASFKGMTVEASTDANGNEVAFLYNWDGSGEAGGDSDLYFNVSKDGQTYTFVIEYYLCNETTEAYQAVQNLKVGDVIDLEGYVYWYNGIQPHIISVKAN